MPACASQPRHAATTATQPTRFLLDRHQQAGPAAAVPRPHLCRPISCRMVSMATLVLPAPVGAHTSMFCGCSGGKGGVSA